MPIPCYSLRRFLLAVVLVVGACSIAVTGGALTARRSQRSPPPESHSPEQPALHIAPEYLDFGEVWETDDFALVIPIHNRSNTPLRLTGWKSSCNCLGVEPGSLEFAPQATKTVTIKLDIASKVRLNPTSTQAVSVNFSGALSNGTTAEWRVLGAVKPLVKHYPDLLFPPASELIQPYGVRQVRLEFNEPVLVTTLESDSPLVIPVRREAELPQAVCPIELRFATTIPVGEHPFTLTVGGETRAPRQRVVKRLAGLLRVAQDIQGEPGHVVFPARAVGEVVEETVTVRSLTGRPVQIESIASDGEGLAAEVVKGEPKIIVQQRATRTGQAVTHARVVARSDGYTPLTSR